MQNHWSTFFSPWSRGVWSLNLSSESVQVSVFSWVNAPTTICTPVSLLACRTTQHCIWVLRGCQLELLSLKIFRVESGRKLLQAGEKKD